MTNKIQTDNDIKNAAKETFKKYKELVIQEAHKNARKNRHSTRKGN